MFRNVTIIHIRNWGKLSDAYITFDKFHVMKLMNEALDKVRREEQSTQSELKNTRYIWFDEFKYSKGHMAFEYIDAETGDILDVIRGRDGRTIKDHFITNYSLQDRNKVEAITTRMNAGYVNIIKELFPTASIIIDRFHLVQLITRSTNKTRVKIMNQFKTSNGEDMKKYRRLKTYWRLLHKKGSDVSDTDYHHYRLFGQRLESSAVDEMLNYNDELKANDDLYQGIMRAIDERDYNALESILDKRCSHEISSYIKTSIRTLRKHLPYIKNSLKYIYNNGRIKGTNNKIKLLNRVAYGFRNFQNYKNRILLHFKLKPMEIVTNVSGENKINPKAA